MAYQEGQERPELEKLRQAVEARDSIKASQGSPNYPTAREMTVREFLFERLGRNRQEGNALQTLLQNLPGDYLDQGCIKLSVLFPKS